MLTFQESLDIITQSIRNIKYPENPRNLYTPIAYLLDLKGKKIRPALALLGCNLFQEDATKALPMALAWEIFHNFTLMHDDIMDKADVRRGEPTVHKKWNENTAILSGDAMLILAYKQLESLPSDKLPQLFHLFSKTAAEICDGQQYDMEFEQRQDVTESEYLEMIRLKTAVMLGGALQSGAIIGNANEKDALALYEFGINLGLSFQIQDDILDVYANPEVFGKNLGGDILCNKKTFLLINALNSPDKESVRELKQWLEVKDKDSEKIEAVTALYNKMNIREIASNKKEEYYAKAIQALDAVSVAEERKKILRELAAELMNRKS